MQEAVELKIVLQDESEAAPATVATAAPVGPVPGMVATPPTQPAPSYQTVKPGAAPSTPAGKVDWSSLSKAEAAELKRMYGLEPPRAGAGRDPSGALFAQQAGAEALLERSEQAIAGAFGSLERIAKQQEAKARAFDPEAEARKLIEREHRAKLVKAAYQNLTEGPADVLPAENAPPNMFSRIGSVASNLGLRGVGSFFGAAGKAADAAGAASGISGGRIAAGTLGAAGEAAAGAGPAGIALGGLAAGAGGPIGAALVAADIGAKLLTSAINSVRGGVENLGNVIERLAGNDNLGSMLKATDSAAEAIGKIPIVGQFFEGAIKLATGTIRVFDQVVDAFVQRGAQLARFSGEITAARAMANVRTMRADIQEAQQLGPGIARMTTAQSELSVAFRELLLPIKKVIVENLASFLEWLVEVLREIRGFGAGTVEAIEDLGQVVVDVITGHFGDAVKDLADMPDKIGKAVADAMKKKEPKGMAIDQLYALANQAQYQPPNGDLGAVNKAMDQLRNRFAPAFQGGF